MEVIQLPTTQHAVLQHGGHIQDIRVYGNTITMTKHDLSMRLLAGVGATCIRVGTKRYGEVLMDCPRCGTSSI